MYLNILHPVRRRQDNLVLVAGRALFAPVMSREREQVLLLSGSSSEDLLLPLSFHQHEELQLSRSFAPNLLELQPVEAQPHAMQV